MEVKKMFDKVKSKAKEKLDKAKEWGKQKSKEVGDFLMENPSIIMPLVGGLSMLAVGASRLAKGNMEKCMVQDENWTGCNYLATHPLTNQEIRELDARMSNGETKGEALEKMGVLREEKKRK